MSKNQILLYYNYVQIADPEILKQDQKQFCQKNDLKGRIIVATEGINGTISGSQVNVDKYVEKMKSDPLFSDTHFKYSEAELDPFPKLSVKVRKELVSLHLGDEDFDPNQISGKHLSADELHDWYEIGKEFYIVDMRNDYEMRVGYFKDSILMPMSNFRELPKALKTIEHLKDKTVVTFCTGGVRCEKASGYLIKNGFNDVYQLYGGIHAYIEKYPNEYFLGSLYVFDGRVVQKQEGNEENKVIIGKCEISGKDTELYVDCGYLHCSGRRHFLICPELVDENGYAFCSDECRKQAYEENQLIKKKISKSS